MLRKLLASVSLDCRLFFFFSSRRRHTRFDCDWSSDVCSSDLETYAIEGNAGSHTVCVNGAAARLVQVGDPIIVISYAQMTPDEAARHHPTIVLLNADNSIRETLTGDRTTPIEILSESL